MGGFLQVNCAVGVVIWEQNLGGNGVHAKITIGIPSSSIQTYCGDDGAVYNKRILVVIIGG